jgi:hypothetical protein
MQNKKMLEKLQIAIACRMSNSQTFAQQICN